MSAKPETQTVNDHAADHRHHSETKRHDYSDQIGPGTWLSDTLHARSESIRGSR